MSFINITDPKKREEIVRDFLTTKRNIQAHEIEKRLGEQSLFREGSKLFKPIIQQTEESSQRLAKSIKETINPIKQQLQALPPPTQPLLAISSPEPEPSDHIKIGPMAKQYLSLSMSRNKADNTFGINFRDGNYYIGNKPVQFEGNDILIGDKEYQGTSGLWSLLVEKNPTDYGDEDLSTYKSIMLETSALHHDNDSRNSRPKSSKSQKWKSILKDIWKSQQKHGQGVIVIPSDPSSLLKRLKILASGFSAGNTTLRDEIVAILDELKRQKIIDNRKYRVIHRNIFK